MKPVLWNFVQKFRRSKKRRPLGSELRSPRIRDAPNEKRAGLKPTSCILATGKVLQKIIIIWPRFLGKLGKKFLYQIFYINFLHHFFHFFTPIFIFYTNFVRQYFPRNSFLNFNIWCKKLRCVTKNWCKNISKNKR